MSVAGLDRPAARSRGAPELKFAHRRIARWIDLTNEGSPRVATVGNVGACHPRVDRRDEGH
jgi:hypothetical protein